MNEAHGSIRCGDFGLFDNMGQIFDSLVHPQKVVKIKNPFGILQTNSQIPQEWVGPFNFLKKILGRPTVQTFILDHQDPCY